MPRIDSSVLKGLGGAIERTRRTIIFEQVEVVVLKDNDTFERSVEQLWELYNFRWGAFHAGTNFPVVKAAFVRYCYTAVRARVARVRNERFHTRCDDPWAVPTPIAAALAGIGRVTLESPALEIIPKWNEELDELLLDQAHTREVTLLLRSVERDADAKLLFAHAIAGDKAGDDMLLALVPVRDNMGRVIELRSRSEFDPIAGLVYLLMGLEPDLVGDAATLPTHPLLIPPVYINAAALMQQMHRFIEAGAA